MTVIAKYEARVSFDQKECLLCVRLKFNWLNRYSKLILTQISCLLYLVWKCVKWTSCLKIGIPVIGIKSEIFKMKYKYIKNILVLKICELASSTHSKSRFYVTPYIPGYLYCGLCLCVYSGNIGITWKIFLNAILIQKKKMA